MKPDASLSRIDVKDVPLHRGVNVSDCPGFALLDPPRDVSSACEPESSFVSAWAGILKIISSVEYGLHAVRTHWRVSNIRHERIGYKRSLANLYRSHDLSCVG